MTATTFSIYTDIITNPEWQPGKIHISHVHPNLSFHEHLVFHIRTLSTRNTAAGQPVTGWLYVPSLPAGDPCITASAPWVPANVTRGRNLPPVESVKWVGLAPWISRTCTQHYLAAARADPIRSMIFFLPNNSTSAPPPEYSAIWDLGTGTVGEENAEAWKEQNDFPVYAVPGAVGNRLMHASSLYSSNMTDAPHGHEMTEYYDSRDYVRLYAYIETASVDDLPSLWIFLLVVLGIMLAIIGLTSLLMHWVQMRRRKSLRRRVANGEVDLEALGIKRLTVPQNILDQMPLYTYGSGEPAQLVPSTTRNETPDSVPADKLDSAPSTRPSTPAPASRIVAAAATSTTNPRKSKPHRPTSLQQPTCAICLDDFIPASGGTQGTIVREMPCQHIFHPECVDTFLRDSSSLCPMCKKTALPTGYCPRVITNAMVRRERMVRRIRPRAEATTRSSSAAGVGDPGSRDRLSPLRRSRAMSRDALSRLSSWNDGRRTSGVVPARGLWNRTSRDAEMEMTTPAAAGGQTPRVQPSSNPTRREWARQRAVAMLGRREAPADPDAEEARSLPRWRRVLLGVFPNASRGEGGADEDAVME